MTSAFACLALVSVAVPAVADTDSAQQPIRVVRADEVDPAARALAARVIALTTPDFEKQILSYLSEMFGQMSAESDNAPEAVWFEKNAGPLLIPHVRVLMTELETLYARSLSLQELQAMVDFYDTPVGRAIGRKQLQLGMDMGAPIQAMQTNYLKSLMERFCADNDCTGTPFDPSAANKSGRR